MSVSINMIVKWAELKAQLDELKIQEMNLRKTIAYSVLNGKVKGVEKRIMGHYEVKATGKLNAKVDEAELKAIWSELGQVERAALKWKPELKMREYGALPSDSNLRKAVTFTPGAPSLEVKPVTIKEE